MTCTEGQGLTCLATPKWLKKKVIGDQKLPDSFAEVGGQAGGLEWIFATAATRVPLHK